MIDDVWYPHRRSSVLARRLSFRKWARYSRQHRSRLRRSRPVQVDTLNFRSRLVQFWRLGTCGQGRVEQRKHTCSKYRRFTSSTSENYVGTGHQQQRLGDPPCAEQVQIHDTCRFSENPASIPITYHHIPSPTKHRQARETAVFAICFKRSHLVQEVA